MMLASRRRLRLAGDIVGKTGNRARKQVFGMNVAERQGRLQQEREEPKARAKAPYGSEPTHLVTVSV